MNHILGINTILHTKNGSKIGNAIVTAKIGNDWEVTTDYGNVVRFNNQDIEKYFTIAFSDYNQETHGLSCQEMQDKVSSGHKHRVIEKRRSFQVQIEDEMNFNLNWAKKDLDTLFSSGALNKDEMSVEQMKQIICALFEKRVDCYMPRLHSQAAARRRWKREINNLRKFI